MPEPKTSRAQELAMLASLLDQTEFEPQEVLRLFAASFSTLPENAMCWSLDHWDQMLPHFLQLAQLCADPANEEVTHREALLIILCLCGEKREKRMFPLLCRLMQQEALLADAIGDDASDMYAEILISTFDGDSAPLRTLTGDFSAGEFNSAISLQVLAYLTADGQMPETEMRAVLVDLYDKLERESLLTFEWVNMIAALGYGDMAGKAENLFAREMLSSFEKIEDFRGDLAATLADPGMASFTRIARLEPFGTAIGELSQWSCFNGEEEEVETGDDEMKRLVDGWMPPEPRFSLQQTAHNPHKNVGRNDPCPCGSGKKFKKCCGV